jgi:hypothetical protein
MDMATNYTDTQMHSFQSQAAPMPRQGQQMSPMVPGAMQQTGMAPRTMTPSPQASIVPTTLENPFYLAGLLRRFIGQNIRVQFLIGTNGPMVDRTGRLIEVGTNYIMLQPNDSDDLVICDLYSIKFVDVIR